MDLTTAAIARIKQWVPPGAVRLYWRLRPRFRFVDSPEARISSASTDGGWEADSVALAEIGKWNAFRELAQRPGPLGFSHEAPDLLDTRNLYHHNVHLSYGYALALAAGRSPRTSVLDWGGGLGHYYLLGRAMVPGVDLDYHIKEVPRLVEEGRRLLPEIHWHEDDGVLRTRYDLVLINGSLQYMEDWEAVLTALANCVAGYLLLTRVPVVQHARRYAAVQREYGTEMIHWQFNQAELLRVVESTGLVLQREILVGGSPYVRGAPEQAEMRGWLFHR